jgi:hypothetical protein
VIRSMLFRAWRRSFTSLGPKTMYFENGPRVSHGLAATDLDKTMRSGHIPAARVVIRVTL